MRSGLLLMLCVSPAARGATLDVCDTCAYTTIARAISAAASGDTISIAEDTYLEDLEITDDLTLVGAGSGLTVLSNVRDGGDSCSITIRGGATVTLTGLTLDDTMGAEDCGIWVNGADVSLTDVQITNHASYAGAGMFIDDGASVTVTDCAFEGLTATYGAALHVQESEVFVDASTFSSNTADYGTIDVWTDSTVHVTGSTFTGNVAARLGAGAITSRDTCTVGVSDSTFELNDSVYSTSTIWSQGDLEVDGVTFTSNGGGVYSSGDVRITSCVFDSNDGGAVHASAGTTTIRDSTFTSNDNAYSWGGAIAIHGGQAEVDGNTFTGNRAGDGGAIHVWDEHGPVYAAVTDNWFLENSADNGGAVYAELDASDGGGRVFLGNNVFCANRAVDGGGLWLESGAASTYSLRNNVVARNVGTDRGGGIHFDGDVAAEFLNNTLVANEAKEGGAAYLAADFGWIGNLVLNTASGNGVSSGSLVPSTHTLLYGGWYSNTAADLGGGLAYFALDATNITADPLLASWTADDDCTDDDFTLASGSPAIDAGDPAYTDADGTRADIGAYGGQGGDGVRDDADGDGFFEGFDCDDTDAGVYPWALEYCDGVDADCDGVVDDSPADGLTWYQDRDGDGFGWYSSTTVACTLPAGYSANRDDCDDWDAATWPGADEFCDGEDDDCDGRVDDEPVDTVWYTDADGDGYGDAAAPVHACAAPSGCVADPTDCDDGDTRFHPRAPETCDEAVDYNCDGSVGDADADADGWIACEDCDDADGAVNPDADDVCDDSDNDCDGLADEDGAIWGTPWYADADGDGHGDPGAAVTDCDAPEGHVASSDDCLDSDAGVRPGATEWCDGVDEDCDGSVDDDAADAEPWYGDADGDGYGTPANVTYACAAPPGYVSRDWDCDDTDAAIHPGAEETWYDGTDADCDGEDDFDRDGDGHASDAYGGDDCDDTDWRVYPGATELASDGLDTNCDGRGGGGRRQPDGCACQVTPGSGGFPGFVALAAALLVRRRRSGGSAVRRAPAVAALAALAAACDEDPTCTRLAAISVTLTVQDDAGAAIPDVAATWRVGDGAATPCEPFGQGVFACGFEVAGDITVTASAPGHAEASRTVTVGADECHVIQEQVTLTLAETGCTDGNRPSIRAEVAGAGGETLYDVWVTYQPDGAEAPRECDESDGHWLCGSEEAGAFTVFAGASGHETEWTEVVVLEDACHVITEDVAFELDWLPD